jgi:superfamily II DNA or RNA helicase
MVYPSIINDNFYSKIIDKYKKYKISKKRRTIEQICFPKQFELQLPQKFLAEYINPKTPYKAVLVFHQIGSGKTCTAISIGEKWKHKRNIHVVVPASLIGNFRSELRSQCANNNYLTEKERAQLKQLHPTDTEYKSIIAKSNERINKYYTIYSFNKFIELAEYNEISLYNSILIIDEVQNVVSEKGKFYKVMYDVIHKAPANLRIVLMSATPMFDKPSEIGLTANLLRIPFEMPTGKEFDNMFIAIKRNIITKKYSYTAKNLDIFKERIKGYISYYRGSPPYVFPEKKIRYVKCEMSEFQYRSYLTVLEAEEKSNKEHKIMRKYRAFKKGEILTLPNNFFIGTRIISNIAFPNRGVAAEGYTSLKGKALELENLKEYSCKFYAIIKRLNRSPGPAFIYSSFLEYGGIKSLIKVLEAQGYKNYTKHGEGKNRFAIMSGEEKKELKDEIKNVFNQPENANGSKLRAILATPAAKEGISLKAVRQMHILEPYFNMSRMYQIIGRAVRTCSHALLPEEKRNVKVYIYLATHPEEKESVDEYIMKLALHKDKLIQQFELAMKEVAIDCELFKNANVYEGEEDIKCEI